jgi:hypothetical protein
MKGWKKLRRTRNMQIEYDPAEGREGASIIGYMRLRVDAIYGWKERV